jgi:hypothetical protein
MEEKTMTIPATREEFMKLLARVNTENPTSGDLQTFRDSLEAFPELLEFGGKLSQQSKEKLINSANMTPGARELVKFGIEKLTTQLNYFDSPILEKLLIEQVTMCYLRLYLFEHMYNAQPSKNTSMPDFSPQWERLLVTAQRRFINSIEALARVRRMGVNIQVNIGTSGGQSMNFSPNHDQVKGDQDGKQASE